MSLVAKLAWLIEMDLCAPVSLDDLAQRCAVSQFHMSRAFRVAIGMAPITYLRARRLSRAAEMLAAGDDDVLQIGLSMQYGSHAAFTRAFVAYFGVNPSTVRKARSTKNLILMEPYKMDKKMLVDIAPPEMKQRDAMRIVGVSAQCSFDDNSPIPGLWQQFNAREDEVVDQPGPAYGVCCDATENGRFRYVAGMEMADGSVPTGMDSVNLPAGRYAVFRHEGHITDLPKTVYTMWNKGLPESGLELRSAPDFELYDHRFDVTTGRGVVELWVPVV